MYSIAKRYDDCNFKVIMNMNDISRHLQHCNVIWKHSRCLSMTKSQQLLVYCGLLPIFQIEGDAEFLLGVKRK